MKKASEKNRKDQREKEEERWRERVRERQRDRENKEIEEITECDLLSGTYTERLIH